MTLLLCMIILAHKIFKYYVLKLPLKYIMPKYNNYYQIDRHKHNLLQIPAVLALLTDNSSHVTGTC